MAPKKPDPKKKPAATVKKPAEPIPLEKTVRATKPLESRQDKQTREAKEIARIKPKATQNPTSQYEPSYTGAFGWGMSYLDGAPFYTWFDIPRMKRDPQARFLESMWQSPFTQVTWAVKATSPQVAEYVDRQLKRFWRNNLPQLLSRFFWYGYAPGGAEFTERNGLIVLEQVRPIEPQDARPLVFKGGPKDKQLAGLQFNNTQVLAPHAFWFGGLRELGKFYDWPKAAGMYEPWAEKCMRNGAKAVRKVWMLANSNRGKVGRYPIGRSEATDEFPEGRENKDLMSEMLDFSAANTNFVLPSDVNPAAPDKPLWDVEWQDSFPDRAGYLDYPGYLDDEMTKGIGIPKEILEASETGSGYSGRMVPMVTWLGSADVMVGLIVQACDWLRYAVGINFGPDAHFEVEPDSLVKQFVQSHKGPGGTGGTPVPGQPPSPQGGGNPDDYTGPRGGHGHRDPLTGRVRYLSSSTVEEGPRFFDMSGKPFGQTGSLIPRETRQRVKEMMRDFRAREMSDGRTQPGPTDQKTRRKQLMVLLAMLEFQRRAHAVNDPESSKPYLDALSKYLKDPDSLHYPLQLSWRADETKTGHVKAIGEAEHAGKVLYGARAEAALRAQESLRNAGDKTKVPAPHPNRDQWRKAGVRAREILNKVANDTHTPEELHELQQHLPYLPMDRLSTARSILRAQFKGVRGRLGQVNALMDHIREEVGVLKQKAVEEAALKHAVGDAESPNAGSPLDHLAANHNDQEALLRGSGDLATHDAINAAYRGEFGDAIKGAVEKGGHWNNHGGDLVKKHAAIGKELAALKDKKTDQVIATAVQNDATDTALDDYYRKQQEAHDAGADQSEIDSALRISEEDARREAASGAGGEGGEGDGHLDDSLQGASDEFDFGANEREPEAVDPFSNATADHTKALQGIPRDSLGWVGGYRVRHNPDGKFQIETQKAYHTGTAAEVNDRIRDAWRQASGQKKQAEAALQRAKEFKEPAWFGGGKQVDDLLRRRAGVPEGATGVSLEPNTLGRTGTVVRDEESGQTHLQLDGGKEVKAVDFEPLESKFSWRVPEQEKPQKAKQEQGDLFAAGKAAVPDDGKRLAAFADAVKKHADAEDRGDGGSQVFIHHIYDRMKQDNPNLTREEFDKNLIDANKSGLVRLSRADLPQALHPDDVKAAETKHLNGEFHFIGAGDANTRRKQRGPGEDEWKTRKTYDEEQAEKNAATPESITTEADWHAEVKKIKAEHARNVWTEVQKRLDNGETVQFNTMTRIFPISPKNRAALRMSPGGEIQVARGKSWDTLAGQALETLAHNVGLSQPDLPDRPEVPDEGHGKASHEMTQAEYIAASQVDPHEVDDYKKMHREHVRQAQDRGDHVPPEVLGDYPDLKPDSPPPPQPDLPVEKTNGLPESVQSNQQEVNHAEAEEAKPAGAEPQRPGPVSEPDNGGTGGGRSSGVDGQERSESVRPRIVTARQQFTKRGDPSVIPESVRQHLNEEQQQGASLAIDAMEKHGGFLLADGTGVGKTRQQLAVGKAFLDKGKKVVVVSPAEVIKPNWGKGTMAGSFAHDSAQMGVPVKLTKGDGDIQPGSVHVTTYNELSKLKGKIDKDTVLILDESHFLKNRESARHKHGKEAMDKAGAVMYATATPGDKPLHVAHLFRAGVFGNAGATKTYEKLGMKLVDQHIGRGEYRKVWKVDPKVGFAESARRLSGLFDQMTKDGLMVKRELSMNGVDVGTHHVAMTPDQHAEIEKVYQKSLADNDNNKAVALMAARLHQEPMKVPATVDMIREELAAGRSPVVFMGRVNDIGGGGDSDTEDADDSESPHSAGTAKALKAALIAAGVPEADIGELHGGATKTAEQKKKAMEAFQSGKSKVMLATIQSGGTGVNLDDTVGNRPRTAILMTPPFTANDMAQAIGRVHRLNTKSNSKVRGVLSDTAIDQWNAQVLNNKFKTLGAITSGDIEKGREAIGQDHGLEHEREPFDWGSSLHYVPKHYAPTPFAHKEIAAKFGGRPVKDRNGDWTTEFPDREAYEKYQKHVAENAPKPQPVKQSGPIDPSRHGYMRNKFDTWSGGKKIPKGTGWVKNINGKWVGFTTDEAVKRIRE